MSATSRSRRAARAEARRTRRWSPPRSAERKARRRRRVGGALKVKLRASAAARRGPRARGVPGRLRVHHQVQVAHLVLVAPARARRRRAVGGVEDARHTQRVARRDGEPGVFGIFPRHNLEQLRELRVARRELDGRGAEGLVQPFFRRRCRSCPRPLEPPAGDGFFQKHLRPERVRVHAEGVRVQRRRVDVRANSLDLRPALARRQREALRVRQHGHEARRNARLQVDGHAARRVGVGGAGELLQVVHLQHERPEPGVAADVEPDAIRQVEVGRVFPPAEDERLGVLPGAHRAARLPAPAGAEHASLARAQSRRGSAGAPEQQHVVHHLRRGARLEPVDVVVLVRHRDRGVRVRVRARGDRVPRGHRDGDGGRAVVVRGRGGPARGDERRERDETRRPRRTTRCATRPHRRRGGVRASNPAPRRRLPQ